MGIASSRSTSAVAGRAATVVAVLVAVGIIAIGVRFLLAPGAAAAGFGLATGPDDPFLTVKGIRDIGSGLMLLAVLATAGRRVLGWVVLAASSMPFGDMSVVLARGGPIGTALGVHGATALVMVAAAVTLLLVSRPGSERADAEAITADAVRAG